MNDQCGRNALDPALVSSLCPQVLPASHLLRKPEQHKKQPCSAAAPLLLVGLKGFPFRCVLVRGAQLAPLPALDTDKVKMQKHRAPSCAPSCAHATNDVGMQQGGRCGQEYKKQSPGIENPTQGTQPRAGTTIHDSSLISELMRGFTQHCRTFCSICTKALQGSKGWSQPFSCTLNLCQSFSSRKASTLLLAQPGCHRERAQEEFWVLLSGAEQGTSCGS